MDDFNASTWNVEYDLLLSDCSYYQTILFEYLEYQREDLLMESRSQGYVQSEVSTHYISNCYSLEFDQIKGNICKYLPILQGDAGLAEVLFSGSAIHSKTGTMVLGDTQVKVCSMC